jgi:lysophospholipase L1-like esterase
MTSPVPRARLRRILHDRRRAHVAMTAALLGDSITRSCLTRAGDWFDWADSGCRYRVVLNAGVGGDTTKGMRERLDRVLAVRPDICVVQAGGNDIVQGRTSTEVLADLDGIVGALVEAGSRPIATTVLPHGDTAPDRLTDVAAINQALPARSDLRVCDWTTPLVDVDGRLQPRHADDGTHPNPR